MATRSDTLTIGMVEARNVERATGLKISAEPRKRSRLHLRLAQAWGNGQRPEWQPGQGLCKVCGKSFCEPGEDAITVSVFGETMTIPTSVCGQARKDDPDYDPNSCAALTAEHYGTGGDIEEREVSEHPKWDELCPPRFKNAVDLDPLPPTIDAVKFARVKSWRMTEAKGLAIKGPSGCGKTTAFWALARDLERAGTAPVVLSSVELYRVLVEAARDIRDVAWLTRCRVLMIDDMGKEKVSPAAAALFWEVLDRRYGYGLPVIVTTRWNGADLRLRFGEESLGDDILRRLNDLCIGVTFDLQVPQHATAA